jgi:ATP-binding cassette subfamily F protein 3
MAPAAPVLSERVVTFDFPEPQPLAPPLYTLDRVSVGYDGRAVLSDLHLTIGDDDRIALLGANGNGKSTLVKLLAGRLQPMAGRVDKSGKLRVGYFGQHQAEELDLSATALAAASRAMPTLPEEKVRAHLGRFGFTQERSETRIENLSGGEKARFLFALMTRDAPNILLLDEPTNHLDIESREALIRALTTYAGAVILVTHDPRLVELIADRLWLVSGGRVRPFDGDLDDYRRLLLEERREARRTGGPGQSGTDAKQRQRRAAAEQRALLAPLKRLADGAERDMATLQKEIARLDAELSEPALYSGDRTRIAGLQRARAAACGKLAEAEDRWLEASAALEPAHAGEPG